MKKTIRAFVGAVLLSTVSLAYAANSPVGYWKTIDDVTNQAKSIIEITENSNHHLSGKVVKLFKGAVQTCTECEGANKNKPVLGMVVMHGLEQSAKNPNVWTDGEILDPKNGKTYHCSVTVVDNGQQLNARGYIGIPLFGRTQTWLRVNSKNAD